MLKHKQLKRSFLISIGLILIVIILIRVFLLPTFEPIPPKGSINAILIKEPVWLSLLSRIFDSLFVSLIVTIGVALYLSYVEIKEDEKKFEVVDAFQLKEIFEKERMQTDIWFFSGGTGRYTRAVTIPELSRISKNTNRHINIKIQVIDPTDALACQNYAQYRDNLKSSKTNYSKWTKQYVTQEIIATLTSCLIYGSANRFLNFEICLKNNYSTLRIDLSSNTAIITKEDPQEPALICRHGSFLYRTYKEEIYQTNKEYKILDIRTSFNYEIQNLTIDQIKEIIHSLNLSKTLSEDDYVQILSLLKENRNPYA